MQVGLVVMDEDPADALKIVLAADRAGVHSLWSIDYYNRSSLTRAAAFAAVSETSIVSTSVTPLFARAPLALAAAAADGSTCLTLSASVRATADSQPKRVQVVTLDLIDPGKQGVEILGHAEMAAGQAVRVAAGQRDYQAGRLLRVGAAAGRELVAYPAVDTAFRRLLAGPAPQRDLAETDGQQARVHAEHGYAVRACLFGEGLGQLHQRRLRGCVGRHQRPSVDACVAGDVDDPAPARRDHMRQRQLGQDECTAKVHFDRLPPFGRPGLPGRPDRPADAGVVDENVAITTSSSATWWTPMMKVDEADTAEAPVSCQRLSCCQELDRLIRLIRRDISGDMR
jgi:hypothetical protein